MPKRGNAPIQGELLQGTLDLLILKTLAIGAAHGHTIANAIEHRSEEVLQVEAGVVLAQAVEAIPDTAVGQHGFRAPLASNIQVISRRPPRRVRHLPCCRFVQRIKHSQQIYRSLIKGFSKCCIGGCKGRRTGECYKYEKACDYAPFPCVAICVDIRT